jgi:prolipoprotein diacylglyceryltransferase
MVLLTVFYIVGITLVLLSLYLSYWRGKRKFNRRNMAGLETFKSYDSSLLAHWLEDSARFLSTVFMILGIIILLYAYFEGDIIRKVTHW